MHSKAQSNTRLKRFGQNKREFPVTALILKNTALLLGCTLVVPEGSMNIKFHSNPSNG